MTRTTSNPWIQVLMLGEARFGILVGGPFDGRCYPLPDPAPTTLEIPGPKARSRAVRYVLRDGYYRFAGQVEPERPAA